MFSDTIKLSKRKGGKMTQPAVVDNTDAHGRVASASITVKPYMPAIGAQIFGADLSRTLSERPAGNRRNLLFAEG